MSMQIIKCPKLAYIAGVFMGDGFFLERSPTSRAELVFVMEDRDILQTVATFHHEISGHSCNLRPFSPSRPHLTRLRLTDTKLARKLRDMTEGKTRLPMLGGKTVRREFIAGLMDTDGHVRWGKNTNAHSRTGVKFNRFVLLFTNSGKWLPDFLSLLNSFGVKTGKPTLKRKYRSEQEADCWQVTINFRSFAEAGLCFRCARKQEIVHAYLVNVRRQAF